MPKDVLKQQALETKMHMFLWEMGLSPRAATSGQASLYGQARPAQPTLGSKTKCFNKKKGLRAALRDFASDQGQELQSLRRSRKRCRVGPGQSARKQPGKQPKHPIFDQFWLFFRLFFGCFAGTSPRTRSAPFSSVFNTGHSALSSWPQRLQDKKHKQTRRQVE